MLNDLDISLNIFMMFSSLSIVLSGFSLIVKSGILLIYVLIFFLAKYALYIN